MQCLDGTNIGSLRPSEDSWLLIVSWFGSISGRPRKNKKAHLNKRDSLFCMAFELAHWVPLPLDSELNINFC